jgi:hypothetical protein
VLPDLVAGDVGLVGALHDPFQGLVIVTVELCVIESHGAILDEGIEVVGLFQVEVILAVVRVGRDELTTHRLMNLPQDYLHLSKQISSRGAAQVLDPGLKQAQPVAQLLGCCTQGGVDVTSS